jgi:hypothetical protein
LQKLLKWVAVGCIALIVILYLFDVDYLLRAVKTIYLKGHTTAFLEDYKEFPNRKIKKGIAQPWAIAKDYNTIKATETLEKTHQELKTVAFIIIKKDNETI